MSKIIRKDSSSSAIGEYNLSEFSPDTSPKKVSRDSSFEPSFITKGEKNFIAGGFDFDYEGGMSQDEIINRSTRDAQEIIKKANDTAETIRAEAKAEGLEEGKNLGYEAGKNETAPVLEAVTKLLNELNGIRQEFYDNAEEEMIHLVINVAKTVIVDTIKDDPSFVRHAIRKAVGQLQNKEQMTIHVNNEDLAEAEKFRPELAKMVESIEKVTFKGDPNLTRGGCMVETNIGSIDARVETQLDAIRESFIRAIEEKKVESDIVETTSEEKTDEPAEPAEPDEPLPDEMKDDPSDES